MGAILGKAMRVTSLRFLCVNTHSKQVQRTCQWNSLQLLVAVSFLKTHVTKEVEQGKKCLDCAMAAYQRVKRPVRQPEGRCCTCVSLPHCQWSQRREENSIHFSSSLQNEHSGFIKYVRLQVLSNWGHPDYTCVYQFRLHGDPAPDGDARGKLSA